MFIVGAGNSAGQGAVHLAAAGDVRRGSVQRVASAVGTGSNAVQLAHLRLAELG